MQGSAGAESIEQGRSGRCDKTGSLAIVLFRRIKREMENSRRSFRLGLLSRADTGTGLPGLPVLARISAGAERGARSLEGSRSTSRGRAAPEDLGPALALLHSRCSLAAAAVSEGRACLHEDGGRAGRARLGEAVAEAAWVQQHCHCRHGLARPLPGPAPPPQCAAVVGALLLLLHLETPTPLFVGTGSGTWSP